MWAGLRRVFTLLAIVALTGGGAKIVDDRTLLGSGLLTTTSAAADPAGPPAPTRGMTDHGGSPFQPPQIPSSMPDYRSGNNQSPLDQNSGISPGSECHGRAARPPHSARPQALPSAASSASPRPWAIWGLSISVLKTWD